jgi:hypothetical protein
MNIFMVSRGKENTGPKLFSFKPQCNGGWMQTQQTCKEVSNSALSQMSTTQGALAKICY